MSTNRYSVRLGQIIDALRTLIAATHKQEQEAKKRFEQRTSGSEHRRSTHLNELEDRTAANQEKYFRESEESLQSIEKQKIERLEHAKRQLEDRQEEIEDEASRMRKQARQGLQEQEWLADSVFEATGTEPRKRLQLTSNEIEIAERQLDELRHRAREFRRRCRVPKATPSEGLEIPTSSVDPERSLQALREHILSIEHVLKHLLSLITVRCFIGPLPVILLILGAFIGWGCGLLALQLTDDADFQSHMVSSLWAGVGGLFLTAILLAGVRRVGQHKFAAIDHEFMDACSKADLMMMDIRRIANEQCELQEHALRDRRDREIREARDSFAPKIEQVTPRRDRRHEKLEDNYQALVEKIETRTAEKLQDHQEHDQSETTRIKQEHDQRQEEIQQSYDEETRAAREERDEVMQHLVTDWERGVINFTTAVQEIHTNEAECLTAPWTDKIWSKWAPSGTFNGHVPYGQFQINVENFADGLPEDDRLQWPGDRKLDLPAMIHLPSDGSVFLEYADQGRDESINALQNIMLRLLLALPPGKIRFTVIDPVGLGQSFAGFMHLADHDELTIIDKIWTEPRHIEQQLNDLTEHMENVIQTYLRNEYETIDDYNSAAGEIAEPYHYLVMADLPSNLSEKAGSRLMSIAQTGARCGVYSLLACDTRQTFPRDVHREDLMESSTVLRFHEGALRRTDKSMSDIPLKMESPPEESLLTSLVQSAGRAAEQSHRVEVPFSVITPEPNDRWSSSSAQDLRVALGQSGATRQQQLVLGRGTSQHALVAGKTGSGKSTLLHVLITNLALWYSPEEIEFYLVDFKKGVEFKTYAEHTLPHARVIAIESDREFGLSVLQRIDLELKTRGELFRTLSVQDLQGYREKQSEPMPRILLVVDEFQELFVDDDKVAQEASLLLDRIVRQGRAFGIHALLGSQTLDGAYSLARSTLGQMGVRIALQCTEADSYLILSEENSAARLLGRPGEAIYNDAGGKVEGNNPFQICWLDDSARDESLGAIHDMATEQGYASNGDQFVFEGNVPANLTQCRSLETLLAAKTPKNVPATLECWLGDAIAIKEPTRFQLQLQSGSNLLIVGQREETVTAVLIAAMLTLGAQAPPADTPEDDGLRFYVLDALPTDSTNHGRLAATGEEMPHPVQAGTQKETEAYMQELGAILSRRRDKGITNESRIIVFAHGLHRLRELRRPEDDFSFSADPDATASPDAIFAELLKDGPAHGIHVITWVDTLNNLNRTLERSGQREFEMRVLFQMGANDSSHLIDNPIASGLGLQRAIMSSEDTGILEKFRPWALPETEWVKLTAARL